MKKIHVLPTSKVSNGYILGKCIKELSDVKVGQFTKTHYSMFSKEYFQPHHIYITSDEEIKEGDWFYDLDTKYVKIKQSWENSHLNFNAKKIILTTDKYLDDVQGIDDEFLEWFFKNPSCEEVEVSYGVLKPFKSIDKGYMIHLPDNEVLEEPKPMKQKQIMSFDEYLKRSKELLNQDKQKQKQHLIDMMKSDEELGLYEEPKQICECTDECLGYLTKECKHIEEPKQETLEEAAERNYNEAGANAYFNNGFIRGAKWQQKRSYSEEEVLDLLRSFYSSFDPIKNPPHTRTIPLWFEQFKKK
jgi:hypothetical protein